MVSSERFDKLDPLKRLFFHGFSFERPGGLGAGHQHLSETDCRKIELFLNKVYKVTLIKYLLPFLVLGCPANQLPNETERPFTIGGALAIFLPEEQCSKFILNPTEYIPGKCHNQSKPAFNDWSPRTAHLREYVLELADLFPQCTAITRLGEKTWIEMPKASTAEFYRRFHDSQDVHLKGVYVRNGPMLFEIRQLETEDEMQTQAQNGFESTPIMEGNKNDDASTKTKLEPGSIIKVADDGQGTCYSAFAGILVAKDGERQLVLLPDGRETQVHKSTDSEQVLARITGRVEKSDLVLAQLKDSVQFQTLLDTTNSVKTIVHSDYLVFGHPCFLTTPATGPQRLFRYGKRFEIARNSGAPPRISRELGAYLTNNPASLCTPNANNPLSGALIRDWFSLMNNPPEDHTPDPLELGQVCGMVSSVNYSSGQGYALRGEDYIVYAEELDSLIEDGWEVAHPRQLTEGTSTESVLEVDI